MQVQAVQIISSWRGVGRNPYIGSPHVVLLIHQCFRHERSADRAVRFGVPHRQRRYRRWSRSRSRPLASPASRANFGCAGRCRWDAGARSGVDGRRGDRHGRSAPGEERFPRQSGRFQDEFEDGRHPAFHRRLKSAPGLCQGDGAASRGHGDCRRPPVGASLNHRSSGTCWPFPSSPSVRHSDFAAARALGALPGFTITLEFSSCLLTVFRAGPCHSWRAR